MSGSLYNVVFQDDYTRYVWSYPVKAKSDSAKALKLFLAEVGTPPRYIRTDNGGEYELAAFRDATPFAAHESRHPAAEPSGRASEIRA